MTLPTPATTLQTPTTAPAAGHHPVPGDVSAATAAAAAAATATATATNANANACDPGPGLDSSAATLAALLDQGRAQGPEYDHGLSNHLPMLLQALHALGAPPARLRAFATGYAPRLSAPPPPAPAGHRPGRAPSQAASASASAPAQPGGPARPGAGPTAGAGGWPPLGDLRAHACWLALFDQAIARDGLAATVRAALPMLMPGVAAGALHGPIRLAHAVQAGHAGEGAMALAYWAAAHHRMSPAGALPPPTLALADWLAAVAALHTADALRQPRISLRMQVWAEAPGFQAVAPALRVDAATLPALGRLAARLYAASGNFTVLHLVTACRAMRVLAPLQPDADGALRWFSIAAAAALRASRLATLDPGALGPPPAPWPWPRLVAAAIASDSDHLAKIVQACRQLAPAWPGAPWRAAATRAVLTLAAP